MKSHLATTPVPVSQTLCSHLLPCRGLTLAHIAANSGQLGVLTWLEREIGSQNLFTADNRGWNVLHFAAIGGHLEALQWLVLQAKSVPALNIDIMTTTSRGETIAQCAAATGQVQILDFLNGVAVLAPPAHSLHHASLPGPDFDHVPPSLTRSSGSASFPSPPALAPMQAPVTPRESVLQVMCRMHSAPDGRTLVHSAALNGRVNVLRYISTVPSLSLFLTSLDAAGSSIAHMGAHIPHMELLEFVRESLPNLLISTDSLGRFPAHVAAECGHLSVLRWMKEVAHLELANMATPLGCNLAHTAALCGRLPVLQFLFNAFGVDYLSQRVTSTGYTIIHCAAVGGHMAVLAWAMQLFGGPRVLLDTTRAGQSAIQLAHESIKEALNHRVAHLIAQEQRETEDQNVNADTVPAHPTTAAKVPRNLVVERQVTPQTTNRTQESRRAPHWNFVDFNAISAPMSSPSLQTTHALDTSTSTTATTELTMEQQQEMETEPERDSPGGFALEELVSHEGIEMNQDQAVDDQETTMEVAIEEVREALPAEVETEAEHVPAGEFVATDDNVTGDAGEEASGVEQEVQDGLEALEADSVLHHVVDGGDQDIPVDEMSFGPHEGAEPADTSGYLDSENPVACEAREVPENEDLPTNVEINDESLPQLRLGPSDLAYVDTFTIHPRHLDSPLPHRHCPQIWKLLTALSRLRVPFLSLLRLLHRLESLKILRPLLTTTPISPTSIHLVWMPFHCILHPPVLDTTEEVSKILTVQLGTYVVLCGLFLNIQRVRLPTKKSLS